MRVLHILNDVTDLGNGIVNTAVDLALEQARQGLVVAVASAGGGYKPLLESAGILHLTLDQSRNPMRLFRAFQSFRRQLREFHPDVVHAHMRTGLLLAWICRRFDRFVLVGHVHNVHDRESVMMGLADRVIAVSQSVASTMATQGIAESKIRIVLNRTLDNLRQPPLEEIAPAILERPSIVTVCGMSHRKGIKEMIEAFEILGRDIPNAHLYLVGNGPQRKLFEQQASRTSVTDRIHFEGFQAEPRAYMLSADVFVLASRRESFGLVLIEARQAGCAIIATDVDGVAEALDWGRAGMLVPPRNVKALVIALRQMMGNNKERTEWQNWGRLGIANYRVSVMASEVRNIYEELLAGNRDSAANRTDRNEIENSSYGIKIRTTRG
jgi:glycosyltransferase involved in cell wall biosynthesis